MGPMSAQISDNGRRLQERNCRVVVLQNHGHATRILQYTASTVSSAPHACADPADWITELQDMIIARAFADLLQGQSKLSRNSRERHQ